MSISAQSIIRRVVETIQDNTSVRWPVSELVRYLNDGQREVVLYRPDAMVTNASMALVGGSRQSLPANGIKLLDTTRNTSGSKRSIQLIQREILDSQVPGWHAITGATEILHFMYDVRDPKIFYVYPPSANSGASLEIVYSALPTDILEPADGATYTGVAGNISIPEIYSNSLQDYVLYRAYTKDSLHSGNAARAATHYQLFASSLGIEIKSAVQSQPSNTGNPNMEPPSGRAA